MALRANETILNGKYRILRLIGEGAMGRVWLAEEPHFGGRRVAIKEPRADLSPADLEELRARYDREVRICAALQSAGVPNIVPAITAEPFENTLLLVMQYMPGGDLAALIAANPQGLPLERVLAIASDLLRALAGVHAHPMEIVHRDVKPSNVLFDAGGNACLADFGLAQAGGLSGRSRLQGRAHPGTPLYMAPEQESATGYLTPAADLFALGCVLWEMLTGQRYKRHRPGTPSSAVRPDVPAWLDEIVARALAEDPWERFQSADEMREALDAGRAGAARASEERRQREAKVRLAEEERRWESDRGRLEATVDRHPTAGPVRRSQSRRPGMPRGALLAVVPVFAAAAAFAALGGAYVWLKSREPAVVQISTAVPSPTMTATPVQMTDTSTPTAEPTKPSTTTQEPTNTPDTLPVTAQGTSLVLEPSTGGYGIQIFVKGTGFEPATMVYIEAFGMTIQPQSNSAGEFLVIAYAPTDENKFKPDRYAVDARDSSGRAARTSFLLTGGQASVPDEPTAAPRNDASEGPMQVGNTWTRPADGMEMVYVPAGSFPMGSQGGNDDVKPVHTVSLGAFWIDRTEVTNEGYGRCVAAGACQASRFADDADYNGGRLPVVGSSWTDADDYCRWAGGRLPTEAEWEYAARGPEGRVYPWGDAWQGGRANIEGNGDGYERTAPVGNFPAGGSWVGALDLAGNVWEWVADWYDADYYARSPGNNPAGPGSGKYRVLRGGSWLNGSIYASCASRGWSVPDFEDNSGFRCARSSP